MERSPSPVSRHRRVGIKSAPLEGAYLRDQNPLDGGKLPEDRVGEFPHPSKTELTQAGLDVINTYCFRISALERIDSNGASPPIRYRRGGMERYSYPVAAAAVRFRTMFS